MHTITIGAAVAAILLASCAAAPQDDGVSDTSPESPRSTVPVAEATTTISLPVESEEPAPPSGEGETALEADDLEPTMTTQPPEENSPQTDQPVDSTPPNNVVVAVTDLAARLGVEESAITVVSVEEVTWPNRGLGCPQPDMSYAQVLVNGSLIVLESEGGTYEYHSGGGRGSFYCPNPTKPVSGEYGDV